MRRITEVRREDYEAILQLLIGTMPGLATEAFECLRALGRDSASALSRFNRLAEKALADPESLLTPDQRAQIASLLIAPESGYRSEWLRVRITPAEAAELREEAEAADLSLSEWVRRRLLDRSS